MATIVLGVGNPICGDDAVGLHVVRALPDRIRDADVIVEEALTGGLPLVERLVGYEHAVIVDSIRDSEADIGEVRRLTPDAFTAVSDSHPHGVDFGTALEYLEKIGGEVPDIVVVGVVIGDCELAEQLSPAVAAAVPRAVDMVLAELR
ncbi:MAG: hydrogenase maturation protease, partial [Thermoplasmatota archaeon]